MQALIAADREAFYVTFTVDEGERYRFGAVDVVSRRRSLSSALALRAIGSVQFLPEPA